MHTVQLQFPGLRAALLPQLLPLVVSDKKRHAMYFDFCRVCRLNLLHKLAALLAVTSVFVTAKIQKYW